MKSSMIAVVGAAVVALSDWGAARYPRSRATSGGRMSTPAPWTRGSTDTNTLSRRRRSRPSGSREPAALQSPRQRLHDRRADLRAGVRRSRRLHGRLSRRLQGRLRGRLQRQAGPVRPALRASQRRAAAIHSRRSLRLASAQRDRYGVRRRLPQRRDARPARSDASLALGFPQRPDLSFGRPRLPFQLR